METLQAVRRKIAGPAEARRKAGHAARAVPGPLRDADPMMDAPGFNAWHADVANSPACALIFQRTLGLPSQVVSNSLLPGAGIAEVAAALRVTPRAPVK
ncbi:MAG TPA: hypothetical protein VFW50_10255 [Streptosporangiaceae bacterium]|nr:hypothetical protein [Streptosporangiaceae bacterium]